jgi:DNA-binding NarL/FixJ family response regulator
MSILRYRVFTVEDYPAMRARIGQLVDKQPNLDLVGQASSVEETLTYLDKVPQDELPHLWLVDLSLPGADGFELIQVLNERFPRTICLVLTSYNHKDYVSKALAAGARGYVVKGDPVKLITAMEDVLSGKRVVPDFYKQYLQIAN